MSNAGRTGPAGAESPLEAVSDLSASPSRIAILATHWLGDSFWALQVAPFIAGLFPRAVINLLIRPANRWLAELWAPRDRVHEVSSLVSDRRREPWRPPWRIWMEAQRLRSALGRVDLLIDLTGTAASALLTRLLSPAWSIGIAGRRVCSISYSVSRPARAFRGHLAEKPWWLLAPAFRGCEGWPSADARRRPRLPERAKFDTSRGGSATLPGESGISRGVLLLPGAGWPQKRWSLERFVHLAQRLHADGQEVRLLFSKAEEDLAARAAGILPGPGHADVLSGPGHAGIRVQVTDGPAMLRMLRSATGVVANDAGGAHLAAALGLPTVALFGPTNPRICGPLGKRVRILRTACPERPEGDQHHCHDTPAYGCPRACTETIPMEDVHAALTSLAGG